MKLTFDQIKAITCGTVLIEQTDGGVQFHRFTQAQRDMYELKSTYRDLSRFYFRLT